MQTVSREALLNLKKILCNLIVFAILLFEGFVKIQPFLQYIEKGEAERSMKES